MSVTWWAYIAGVGTVPTAAVVIATLAGFVGWYRNRPRKLKVGVSDETLVMPPASDYPGQEP